MRPTLGAAAVARRSAPGRPSRTPRVARRAQRPGAHRADHAGRRAGPGVRRRRGRGAGAQDLARWLARLSSPRPAPPAAGLAVLFRHLLHVTRAAPGAPVPLATTRRARARCPDFLHTLPAAAPRRGCFPRRRVHQDGRLRRPSRTARQHRPRFGAGRLLGDAVCLPGRDAAAQHHPSDAPGATRCRNLVWPKRGVPR